MNPVSILYHADCLDGFGAAYAAWRRFGNRAHYRPLHHGDRWQFAELAGHTVYLLDFSLPPTELAELATVAASVTQIDHHVSAMQAWADRLEKGANNCWIYQAADQRLRLIFNLEKSGARLAWEYFHPDSVLPDLLRHVEAQDLWRFDHPDTRPFCRALRLRDFAFDTWHEIALSTDDPESATYQAFITQGDAIEQFLATEIERLAQSNLCQPVHLRGEPIDALQAMRHGQKIISDGASAWLAIPGLGINANAVFASELGNRLAEQSNSFALVWQLGADGIVKASLRAQGKVDVALIASRYGGGGHPNAAGFRLPLAQFSREILGIPLATSS